MPELKTVKQVKGFIGAIRYYSRFIPAFSRLAVPLLQVTKKFARLKWSEDCQKAFDYLKEQLTAIPLLTYPDLSKSMMPVINVSVTSLINPCPDRRGTGILLVP